MLDLSDTLGIEVAQRVTQRECALGSQDRLFCRLVQYFFIFDSHIYVHAGLFLTPPTRRCYLYCTDVIVHIGHSIAKLLCRAIVFIRARVMRKLAL